MKNNRKNRKLNFIKAKNSLRLGFGKYKCYQRFSNELLKEEYKETYKELIDSLILDTKNSLFKRYKLKLNSVELVQSYSPDDFIKDLHTNMIVLSLK